MATSSSTRRLSTTRASSRCSKTPIDAVRLWPWSRARRADADKLQQIVTGGGEASCSEGNSPGIALYGLQRTSAQHPRIQATYCASDLELRSDKLGSPMAETERFALAPRTSPAAATAETQAAVATPAATGSENIEDLDIQAALCSAYETQNGAEIVINNYASGLRDLQQLIDYYYVDQLIQTTSPELDDAPHFRQPVGPKWNNHNRVSRLDLC